MIGKEVIRLTKCESTNDYAKNELRKDNLKNGQVILTEYQTGGRGRSGKFWESEPNSNILMTLFLEPERLLASNQYLLNILASLAVLNTLKEFIPSSPLRVKWPNDVYFGDKKIAGILIENYISGKMIDESLIGIGLNVNQAFFNTPNATSIYQITRHIYNLDEVFNVLISEFESLYNHLKNRQIEKLVITYNHLLYWKDQKHLFETNKKWEGVIRGTDKSGHLKIERDGKIELFSQNEINFIK